MAAIDPFERAAEREEQEEFRREMKRMWMWGRARRYGHSGLVVAIIVFGIPYVVWGLIRAASFHFGDPTIPQSVVRYFFGHWWTFGAYSGWMLFLLWAWAIEAASRRVRD